MDITVMSSTHFIEGPDRFIFYKRIGLLFPRIISQNSGHNNFIIYSPIKIFFTINFIKYLNIYYCIW